MVKKPKKTVPGGMVVIFEGIDGAGKTTQLNLVHEELISRGYGVHATRNLGGTPIGEALRQVAFSPVERSPETDLYISAAIQAELAKSIESERRSGKIVLVDRGPLSLAAYHIYGNGVGPKLGWQFADEGMARFQPNLVVLYKIELNEALKRAKRRKGHTDYYASKPKGYFRRVENGYEAGAKRYSSVVTRLDASDDIGAVHSQTMEEIDAVLRRRGI
jgi:dTMP kinase